MVFIMQINSVSFVKSASKLVECPAPDFVEIAVIGRSNVGKSTLINMLMQKPIAKSSDKPGKTQLINYFLVNENWYFVDLPGYGYAKASLESRRKWIDETYEYFIDRKPLILVLIDGNISPQKIDLDFLQALSEESLDFVIVVTKACTSAKIGRVPSMVTTMEDPVAPSSRSSRKTSLGLITSTSPPDCISKMPISLVEPKRFLTARKIRKVCWRSPSK